MNINARRGTAARHRSNLDRFVRVFLLVTAAVVIIGYYFFLSSALSNFRRDNIHTSYNAATQKQNRVSNNNEKKAKATIGYAITVTGCPKNDGSRGDFGAGILDGAAVLKHSIHLNSIRSNDNHRHQQHTSQYDYQMYALVHPDAEQCARAQLQPLDYTILIRDVPVPLHEIRGDYLRSRVPNNGCCGDKEFVKLHAYTIMEHPVVVHLDLDTLVLKPMDHLYDAMIDGYGINNEGGNILDVAFNDPIDTTQPINAFFTRDYNMAHRGMKHVGVQGGFLVLRPSMEIYTEFQDVIRVGDFRENGGWGGMGFGPFYGVSVY
jgi:alpha-N-acetylglucosamine transferase